MQKRSMTAAPAVAMTAVSMVLTVVVIVMWLGEAMHWGVALVVGLGLDGGWLATLAYDRRLAAQGDHSRPITVIGWGFGLLATGVLVAHALGEESAGAWLAVAWLPLAAKCLWVVHGLWERTALTPDALDQIREIQQTARDRAAVARAQLRAEAGTEVTRLEAVTGAGARVARVQAETAGDLASAWSTLEAARAEDGTARALTCVTSRVTPACSRLVTARLGPTDVWGPTEPVPAIEAQSAEVVPLSNEEIDSIMSGLVDCGSYRVAAARFRDMGYSAGEARLQASWRRVTREVAA
nr:protein spdB [Streptomyces silaceus]